MIIKNNQKVTAKNVLECQFGNSIKKLKINRLSKASNIHKKKL